MGTLIMSDSKNNITAVIVNTGDEEQVCIIDNMSKYSKGHFILSKSRFIVFLKREPEFLVFDNKDVRILKNVDSEKVKKKLSTKSICIEKLNHMVFNAPKTDKIASIMQELKELSGKELSSLEAHNISKDIDELDDDILKLIESAKNKDSSKVIEKDKKPKKEIHKDKKKQQSKDIKDKKDKKDNLSDSDNSSSSGDSSSSNSSNDASNSISSDNQKSESSNNSSDNCSSSGNSDSDSDGSSSDPSSEIQDDDEVFIKQGYTTKSNKKSKDELQEALDRSSTVTDRGKELLAELTKSVFAIQKIESGKDKSSKADKKSGKEK